MAQKANSWPFFAEATVRSHFSSGEIFGGQRGIGGRFFLFLKFSAVRIIPTHLHSHHHLCTCFFVLVGQTDETWTPFK